MSGRCKACNEILLEAEMKYKNEHGYLDLCTNCVHETLLAESGYYENDYSHNDFFKEGRRYSYRNKDYE